MFSELGTYFIAMVKEQKRPVLLFPGSLMDYEPAGLLNLLETLAHLQSVILQTLL